jgi:2-amino-4-hydroxy-6-hydroxymethyldihydropteridine diphosphokinase
MPQVAVSIGSNLDRENNVKKAVVCLASIFGALSCSPVYESKASGFDGPSFYNLVVIFETSLDVLNVCEEMRAIEEIQGRQMGEGRKGSRSLDLDLLLYGNFVLYEAGLDIPRREILEHAYILKPLADVFPGGRHPVTGDLFRETWSLLGSQQEALSHVAALELDCLG